MKQTRSLSEFSCLSEHTRLYPSNASISGTLEPNAILEPNAYFKKISVIFEPNEIIKLQLDMEFFDFCR